MATILPIEIYDLLEKKIGKEEAREVAKAIEQSLDTIEKKAEAVALQKKLEIRDELSKDFKDDLRLILEGMATKTELKTLEERFSRKIDNLRWEFRLYFLIIIIIVLFLNPRAFDLISRLLGIVK